MQKKLTERPRSKLINGKNKLDENEKINKQLVEKGEEGGVGGEREGLTINDEEEIAKRALMGDDKAIK